MGMSTPLADEPSDASPRISHQGHPQAPGRAVAIAKITNNRAGNQVTQTMVLKKHQKVP